MNTTAERPQPVSESEDAVCQVTPVQTGRVCRGGGGGGVRGGGLGLKKDTQQFADSLNGKKKNRKQQVIQ